VLAAVASAQICAATLMSALPLIASVTRTSVV
jgi:hypothetical protein